MPMSRKKLISLTTLIVLAALLAACGAGLPILEPFTSPDPTPTLASPLSVPDSDPSTPPPADVEDDDLPTATVDPPDTKLPRLTPIPLPEETPPMETHPIDPSQAPEAVEAARAFLARHLNIPAYEIELISVEPVNWPDTSLGCPQPGHVYLQVITPGYRVLFEAHGREYQVHTDRTGRQLVLCDNGARDGRGMPYSEE